MTATPHFETADQVWSYLASIGQFRDKHDHLWVQWAAWESGGLADPHQGRSLLFVCDVPDCIEVKTERRRETR